MTYIEGFVVAVPTANCQAYLAHATSAVGFLREFGVARMVENWGDEVPVGTLNDFAGAVQTTAEETVVFSWFEYPDKAARDAASARMMTDPRMEAMGASMPFDGSRMIYAVSRRTSRKARQRAPDMSMASSCPSHLRTRTRISRWRVRCRQPSSKTARSA